MRVVDAWHDGAPVKVYDVCGRPDQRGDLVVAPDRAHAVAAYRHRFDDLVTARCDDLPSP